MSTASKENILRRILDLPAIHLISRLRHSAPPFSPSTAPRPPSHHLPDPCSSVLGASHTPSQTKETSFLQPPAVTPTPSKKGGRILFPPPRSPTEKSSSPPPPPNSPPPPPLPSQFNTGGQFKNKNLPTFLRPTPNSGPHKIPPSPNMGGPFQTPPSFPTTSSPSSQFFQPSPLHVLHPYIHQNIINCLQSINYFFASVLTTIPVHVHPSPYGSNSYI